MRSSRCLRSTMPIAVALSLLLGAALLLAPPSAAEDGPVVERRAGADRFATAAAISADAFPDGVDEVLVATGGAFPDALAAAPVAAAAGGPVLLATRTSLPDATREELRRLLPTRVTVLGGPGAVGDAVLDEIADVTGAAVGRLAGSDRIETAALLSAERFAPGVQSVYLAAAADFPDALAGGAAAGTVPAPILLAARDTLPEDTAAELERLAPGEVIVLGGAGAISAAVAERAGAAAGSSVRRLAGGDRVATAVAISAATYPDGASVAFLATAGGFADALAGAPVAAGAGGPVLLVRGDCVPGAVLDELSRLDVDRVVLLGGSGVLGDGVAELTPCSAPQGPVEVATTVVVDGLTQPWDVVHAPDGRAYVTERDTRRLLAIEPDGGVREVQRLEANTQGEGGLLGLAVSPTFTADGLLYAYITTADDNRVVRFRPGSPPEPVLTGIPRAGIHNGGRIEFGPDGLLYIGTGDAAAPSLAQDQSSLAGKILRITPDGGVPAGNPFPGSPVFSLGHRNVQGLAFDAEGALYATEFGPSVDDEINRVVPGGNYGWPTVTGRAGDARFVDPVIVRQPPEASWSGATFLVDGAIPQWEGQLFAAALRGQRLWRFEVDGAREVSAATLLVGEVGRLRTARQAPDGSLWVVTGNGGQDRILRVGPAPAD